MKALKLFRRPRPGSRAQRQLLRPIAMLAIPFWATGVSTQPAAQPPSLEEVLFRANQAVVAFEQVFVNVLADEIYRQRVVSRDDEVRRSRDIESRVLFFRQPEADTWTGYREVLEIDGEPQEVDGRWLFQLADDLADFPRSAARVHVSGERHYLGEAPRSVSVATLALSFLHPLNQHRCYFAMSGEEVVDGIRTHVVEFTEHRRPTLVRTGRGDLFARGTFWIDPESGRLARSRLVVGGPSTNIRLRAEVTVTFGPDSGLGVWVPREMQEVYRDMRENGADRIEGTATYGRFRSLAAELASATPAS